MGSIHEKTLRLKISCYCPFNVFVWFNNKSTKTDIKKNSLDSLFLHLPLKRKPSNTVKILSSDKFFSVHDTFTPSPPLVSQKYTLFYFLMLFRE
jgi:hypothetical protein